MKRSLRAHWLGLLLVFVCVASGSANAAPQFPQLSGRVVDQANILSPDTEARLSQRLERLETSTGRQLVVVTLASLQGYEIEDFGYQLGRAWKIGRASEDDGTLFVVAPNERSVRIEVGYGLEALLTDALASVLLNERVLPHFRAGNMEAGVIDGTTALADQLALPAEEARERVDAAREATADQGVMPSFLTLLLVFWILMMVMRVFGPRRRRRRSGWMIPPIIVSGGGWGGGGGSRSGGFSGGGGSFGGGGASGRW